MVVYIISREEWGLMKMSKHHYAIELAKMGNVVYFINCPDRKNIMEKGDVQVVKTEYENLYEVKNRFFLPLDLKYKSFFLFKWLIFFHIRKISKKINNKPNLIWTFDAGADLPVDLFEAHPKIIYMPVDGPFMDDFELITGKSADLIVSVTSKIIRRYAEFNCKKLIVNHGVNSAFFSIEKKNLGQTVKRIGYSGSLVRSDLKFNFFKRLIKENIDIQFEFWGEYDIYNSTIHNLNDISLETKDFILFLMNAKNVILHGAVDQFELCEGLNKMDLLIIAYNISEDQNHHKVNEYLSTGKLIFSTYMSSFDGSDLLVMAENNCLEDDLLILFKSVLINYTLYMTESQIKKRIEFAQINSYSSLTKKILQELS
jgi:hypothetical protein